MSDTHAVGQTRKTGGSTENELRALIVRGAIPPGARLVESRLATDLGCSRGSVREALHALAAIDLVTLEKNRGARIRSISKKDAVQIGEVLHPLMILLGSRAAVNRTEPEARRLRERAALVRATQLSGDAGTESEHCDAILRSTASCARHEAARRQFCLLFDQLWRWRLESAPQGVVSSGSDAYLSLVDAVAAADDAGARRAMDVIHRGLFRRAMRPAI